MEIIGQKKLQSQINSFTINNFPRTSLILGDVGSGKHLFVNFIASKFNLILEDITNNISFDYISELYTRANPYLYLINVSSMDEKKQNMILKLIEEPLNTMFIVLVSVSKNVLLDTIINRCYTFILEDYTKEDLSLFVKDGENKDLILSMCTTPGMILNTNTQQLQDINDITLKMISSLSKASIGNTLLLRNKFNYKDEYDKFDINLFFKILKKNLYIEYCKNKLDLTYEMYQYVLNTEKKLIDVRVNKEHLIDNFLINIWGLCNGI